MHLAYEDEQKDDKHCQKRGESSFCDHLSTKQIKRLEVLGSVR